MLRPVAIILLERCAGVGVEEIQQIDGDVRARAADVELADAEVDLIDAVRIFLSWQQEVDLLAGRKETDSRKGRCCSFPGVAPTPNVALGWKRMMPLKHVDPRNDMRAKRERVCQDSTLATSRSAGRRSSCKPR